MLVRARATLILGALGLGLGLGVGACVPNCAGLNPDCEAACAATGECGRRTYRAGDGFARCYVRDSKDCAQSEACKTEGRCHLFDGITPDRCVALSDLDCRASTQCATEGKCVLGNLGACAIEPSACARTDACRERGTCNYAHAKGCVDGAAQCELACRLEGACDLVDGICAATREADCRAAARCRGEGQCALEGDRCVATDEGCAASSMCEHNGWCAAVEGGDGCYDGRTACGATCWTRGDCARVDGVCQPASDAECEASVACAVSGRCAIGGRPAVLCGATQDSHCAQSLEGQAFGRCERSGIACSTDGRKASMSGCIGRPECASEGRCLTTDAGACVTAAEAGLPEWTPPPMIR